MKLHKSALVHCAVSDCTATATHIAKISVNNRAPKRLPVCACHRDAATEDKPVRRVLRSQRHMRHEQ